MRRKKTSGPTIAYWDQQYEYLSKQRIKRQADQEFRKESDRVGIKEQGCVEGEDQTWIVDRAPSLVKIQSNKS